MDEVFFDEMIEDIAARGAAIIPQWREIIDRMEENGSLSFADARAARAYLARVARN